MDREHNPLPFAVASATESLLQKKYLFTGSQILTLLKFVKTENRFEEGPPRGALLPQAFHFACKMIAESRGPTPRLLSFDGRCFAVF